jgi:hypothetical protein
MLGFPDLFKKDSSPSFSFLHYEIEPPSITLSFFSPGSDSGDSDAVRHFIRLSTSHWITTCMCDVGLSDEMCEHVTRSKEFLLNVLAQQESFSSVVKKVLKGEKNIRNNFVKGAKKQSGEDKDETKRNKRVNSDGKIIIVLSP